MGLGPPASLRLRLLCPAKINLHLRVGALRDDGFHPLLTWMCTVGLFDSLTLQTLPGPPGSSERTSASPRAVREGSGRDTSPGVSPMGESPGGDARPPGVAGGSGSERGRERDFAGSPGIVSGPAGEWPVGAGGGGCEQRSTLSSDAPSVGEVAALLLQTDSPGLPRDHRNLVVRVAAAWGAEAWPEVWPVAGASDAAAPAAAASGRAGSASARRPEGHGFFPVRAVLEKRIPVGAGLGGGSSDAARTLLGLERLRREWLKAFGQNALGQDAPAPAGGRVQDTAEKRRPANDLSAFAGRFGSDVPFFVRAAFPPPVGGPSAVCTGRGEVVTPVAPPAARWAVLVLPEIELSTADVYRRFDEMGLGRREDVDAGGAPDWPAWSRLAAQDLLPRLVNDLEAPAYSLRPDLADLRAAAEQALGRTVRMSGSGSSLFTLFDSRADADAALVQLREALGVRAEVVELAPRIDDDLADNDLGGRL